MPNSPLTIFIILAVFGFLSASTIYFYNKSKPVDVDKQNSTTFNAELPKESSEPSKVDQNTVAGEPKNLLSYPANTYKVQPRESLFAIGEKMGVSWLIIKAANGLRDENLIQADFSLVIPKLSKETDYYRVNFLINEVRASELNRELRDQQESEWYDPVEVVKKTAQSYFGITDQDQMKLVEANYSNGTALVEAKTEERENYIGLIQPKTKGQKGLWALYYVESRKR